MVNRIIEHNDLVEGMIEDFPEQLEASPVQTGETKITIDKSNATDQEAGVLAQIGQAVQQLWKSRGYNTPLPVIGANPRMKNKPFQLVCKRVGESDSSSAIGIASGDHFSGKRMVIDVNIPMISVMNGVMNGEGLELICMALELIQKPGNTDRPSVEPNWGGLSRIAGRFASNYERIGMTVRLNPKRGDIERVSYPKGAPRLWDNADLAKQDAHCKAYAMRLWMEQHCNIKGLFGYKREQEVPEARTEKRKSRNWICPLCDDKVYKGRDTFYKGEHFCQPEGHPYVPCDVGGDTLPKSAWDIEKMRAMRSQPEVARRFMVETVAPYDNAYESTLEQKKEEATLVAAFRNLPLEDQRKILAS